MMQQNRACSAQPWGTLLPAIAIALLTIGTGLIADGIARAPPASTAEGGRDERDARRRSALRIDRPPAATTSSTRSTSRSSPARCSDWWASPAPARPRSGSPCSVTPARACGSPAVSIGSTRLDAGAAVAELRRARGTARQLRAPGPEVALNPALRIGKQLLEVLEHHGFGGCDEAPRRARSR